MHFTASANPLDTLSLAATSFSSREVYDSTRARSRLDDNGRRVDDSARRVERVDDSRHTTLPLLAGLPTQKAHRLLSSEGTSPVLLRQLTSTKSHAEGHCEDDVGPERTRRNSKSAAPDSGAGLPKHQRSHMPFHSHTTTNNSHSGQSTNTGSTTQWPSHTDSPNLSATSTSASTLPIPSSVLASNPASIRVATPQSRSSSAEDLPSPALERNSARSPPPDKSNPDSPSVPPPLAHNTAGGTGGLPPNSNSNSGSTTRGDVTATPTSTATVSAGILPGGLAVMGRAPPPTGHRRGITSREMVPVDAPTQPRRRTTIRASASSVSASQPSSSAGALLARDLSSTGRDVGREGVEDDEMGVTAGAGDAGRGREIAPEDLDIESSQSQPSNVSFSPLFLFGVALRHNGTIAKRPSGQSKTGLRDIEGAKGP